MHSLANAKKKVIGLKQSIKAVEKGLVQIVFLAYDADEKIRQSVLKLCKDREIQVVESVTMVELGKASGIQVGTAVAAILEPETTE
ncbi:MAG: 50S ribosomal protein L7Ae-like protein [Firmicutes bacterium HGW-Firmicutes-12]|nr:MAG: 50S ribosomal protein L7Ae-like protein [Firmicutes bacterium HGW-Firmicutes-12]